MSLPSLMREIEMELEESTSSRTRDALTSGKLKLKYCDFCDGSGKVP